MSNLSSDKLENGGIVLLNERKALSKNRNPVAFLIEKTDDDHHLFFFIDRIKGKIVIDHYETNLPTG